MLKINVWSQIVYNSNCHISQPLSTIPVNKTFQSFRGAPWRLEPSSVGVSNYGSITADDAIKLYKKLACGNYLDIGEDKYNYTYCNKIRENNLAFLDRITSTTEKQKFINYFKTLTGFPYLNIVSRNIKNEFVNAISKTSKDLYHPEYKVLHAGYDGVCSVGHKKALPGSDIDKAYVIIQGRGYDYGDIDAVNNFKAGIWKNTDQRILSYNHDDAAFPQVYTITQLKKLTKAAENVAQNLFGTYEHDGRGCPSHHYYEQDMRHRRLHMFKEGQKHYTSDYVDANDFYINVCKKFPLNSYGGISREQIKNVGFVLESMREGEHFKEFGEIDDKDITGSLVYEMVNLSQLHSLKHKADSKPKRLARENMPFDFNSWDVNKQYRFVKALIQSACGNNKSFTNEFENYFSKPGQDLFEPLLKALME